MIKVLVVDDEVPIRQWLEFCINKIDPYRVVGAASNGAEGYSEFRKLSPDIVITDIRMPVMDGLEMIGMIRGLKPSVYTVVLTSHEDFEYARKAIKLGASDYILKTEITEEQLKEILDKGKTDLGEDDNQGQLERAFEEMADRNHYLRSLVLSKEHSVVGKGFLKEYGIPLEKGEFIALDVMTEQEGAVHVKLPEGSLLDHVFKVSVDMNHTIIVGNIGKVSPVHSRRMEEISYYCGNLMKQFPCKIGCSDIYDDSGRLGDAMKQAHDRTSLSFYYPHQTFFYSQSVKEDHLPNGELFKMLFTKELVNQNFSRALVVKDKLIAEAAETKVTDIGYLKEVYSFFVTSLFHFTMDDEEKAENVLKPVIQEMKETCSLEALNAVLERQFKASSIGMHSEDEYSALVGSALRYMETSFDGPITLSEVAEYAGVSAEYLSRQFKEETGVKFVVYLNNLRLKNALHLLETTNLKVYEVAERVGYSNLSYFSTVFKKNFGQNPFDYKNSFKNKGDI